MPIYSAEYIQEMVVKLNAWMAGVEFARDLDSGNNDPTLTMVNEVCCILHEHLDLLKQHTKTGSE